MQLPVVIYTETDEPIEIQGYSFTNNVISIYGKKLKENLNGFMIYMGEHLVVDASDFVYRWDVIDHKPNAIYYTNDPDCRQTEPFPDLSDVQEQAEPLTNEELAEAIADMMYETSLAQLGI